MANALSQEIRGVEPPEPIKVEAAELWTDLKTWDPRASFGLCLVMGAVAVYALWFGVLAIFDIWRRAVLDPQQIAVILPGLILQSSLSWVFRVPQLAGGVALGVVLSVPAILMAISNSSQGDYLHATLFILTPIALCIGNAHLVSVFLNHCELPSRRGDSRD